jgi:predicted  nucleic acid-binding Zn-ribbon protein
VKADPDAQRRLLDLAAIDTTLSQLAHRSRNLPEHADLQRQEESLRDLADERAKARVAVDDLDRDIARLERDVEQVRQRAARD